MDSMIINNDVRVRSHVVGTYRGHTQEIYGLKWSESGKQLASEGNDNLVHIRSLLMRSPNNSRQWIHRMTDHTAAVKALSWCPFQSNMVASGGGVGDQCIKFWNINAGSCLNTVDTGSQSPDGYTVATAAADETLRLWNDFRNPEENQSVLKRKLDPFFDLVFHVITIIIKGEATNAKETTWKYSKLQFYEFKLPKQSLAEMHGALTSTANERPFSASTTTLLLYLMAKWRSCCKKLDRFIPNYSAMDFDYAHYMLSGGKVKKEHVGVNSSSKEAYLKLFVTPQNRVPGRHTSAERTLEAPDIPDDFYLNLLDWGSSNVIAIGLGNSVYLWDASDGSTTELLTVGDDFEPVTSVSWSPDGRHLAIALNNLHVQLWDSLQGSNQLSNMVASGCGVGDQCINFWNTNTGECMNTVDTGSQVCSLICNRHECELLSSYGFTDNQLTVWKYPFMMKISKLFGHTSRVLHMAQSSDGYTVATAAADETLRLWNIFGNPEENKPMLKRKLEPFFDLVQLR
ncbi:Cell division cycle 20.5, cofactor of APC complex [Capsicum annuum]|nr:Cell division cycle 20.5, cofactor of APC complex [Capsicum annuum]KAF3653146.1 Cell division cycle 20.5, cofactor of APC complex [Capsicum annuum]